MQFSKKLENIWFYYKYYILVGVLMLVAVAFAVASCNGKGIYDINVLYMTHEYVDLTGELDTLLSEHAADTNGDGTANAQVITINYGTTVKESQSAGAARAANLAAGKNVLFLADEQNYTELKNGGFLMDLSDLGTSQYLSGDKFDATGSGLLSSIEEFTKTKSKYYLCIRTFDEDKAKEDKKYAAQYTAAFDFMKNVLEKYQ